MQQLNAAIVHKAHACRYTRERILIIEDLKNSSSYSFLPFLYRYYNGILFYDIDQSCQTVCALQV